MNQEKSSLFSKSKKEIGIVALATVLTISGGIEMGREISKEWRERGVSISTPTKESPSPTVATPEVKKSEAPL